jgi:hypothetical protein
MWDAVILGCKQAVLSFETFENLQHTYSWMKYYNNELEQDRSHTDGGLEETLKEVQNSINQSIVLLKASGDVNRYGTRQQIR